MATERGEPRRRSALQGSNENAATAASAQPYMELVNVWKRFGQGERQTVAVRNVDLAI